MAERIKKINQDITSYLYSLSDSFTILSNYFKKLAQLSAQTSKKKNKNVISKEKIKNEKEEDNNSESNNKFLTKKKKIF